MSHLIQGQRTQAGELTPLVSGHSTDKRAFPINDLVMRQGQHEVLVERVHNRERQHAVVTGTPWKVRLHVVQRIIHPAHIPFEMES